MPALLPALTLSIELSPNLEASHTRERCPSARVDLVTAEGVRHVATLRVDVESPHIDLPDAAVRQIDAADIIGRAIDEAAWLAELARVLQPGGELRMRVASGGPLAWYDTRNIYRYMTDIFGRGDNPDDTLPTGWNRHYATEDIVTLLLDAGFANIRIVRVGLGLAEAPQLAGLTIGNFLLGKRDTEYRLRPMRERLERLDARIPAPFVGTAFAITATRARTEPDDPAADAPDNRPAPEIDSE
jgi:hypothetical protein